MLALVAFYRDQGCCGVCALGFAVAEVEREAGRKAEKPRSCEACRDIAVKCYPQRPNGARG